MSTEEAQLIEAQLREAEAEALRLDRLASDALLEVEAAETDYREMIIRSRDALQTSKNFYADAQHRAREAHARVTELKNERRRTRGQLTVPRRA